MELEHSFSLAAVIAISTPLLIALPVFLCSLLLVMGAAAWFTRRLELLCDRLDLSAGMLSMLGALGANIPNYVASMVAIASGQLDVGLGIIIGSNIYNSAIIMGISALAAPGWHGIRLQSKEIRDVRIIAAYALAIMLATLLLVWLLLDAPLMVALTLAILLGVRRGNVSRVVGVVLLLSYTVWVIVHLLL